MKNEKKLKNQDTFLYLVIFFFVMLLASTIGSEISKNPLSFNENSLEKISNDLNKKLPMAIDEYITWEKTTAVTPRKIIYDYQISEDFKKINTYTEKEMLDLQSLRLKDLYCNNEDSLYRKNKIVLIAMIYIGDYPYLKIEAGPGDCI